MISREEFQAHRGADHLGAAAGRHRDESAGDLPPAGHLSSHFYPWKKYGGLGLAELRRLKQLEHENGRLKQLVADLSLDKEMLQEVVRKKL